MPYSGKPRTTERSGGSQAEPPIGLVVETSGIQQAEAVRIDYAAIDYAAQENRLAELQERKPEEPLRFYLGGWSRGTTT